MKNKDNKFVFAVQHLHTYKCDDANARNRQKKRKCRLSHWNESLQGGEKLSLSLIFTAKILQDLGSFVCFRLPKVVER